MGTRLSEKQSNNGSFHTTPHHSRGSGTSQVPLCLVAHASRVVFLSQLAHSSCPGSRCTCLPCRGPNATSESSKMHLHIPTSDHIEFCESQYDCLLHQIWGMLTLSVSARCYAGDFDLSLLSSALTMPMCGTTSSDLTTASH